MNEFTFVRRNGQLLLENTNELLGQNNRVFPTLETESGDINFTGKVIINPEPLCLKEARFFEGNATTDQIFDGSAQFTSLKTPNSLTSNTELTLPSSLGAANTVITDVAGDGVLSFQSVAALGVVSGTPPSTDHAIARYDGITGLVIQNSVLTVDDSGDIDKSGVDFIHERGGSDNLGVGSSALSSVTAGGSQNTAVGQNTLAVNTTGDDNTAFGADALTVNITGNGNTAVGSSALASNTASENTAVGVGVLTSNTTGTQNTGIGLTALASNITGDDNTAVGWRALLNTTVGENTAVGSGCLTAAITGTGLVGMGYQALNALTTGTNSTAVGQNALGVNITGDDNTAAGHNALAVFEGSDCTAFGSQAMASMVSGTLATAVGHHAMRLSTNSNNNSAFGFCSLENVISSGANCAFGAESLTNLVSGSNNVGMGRRALNDLVDGGNNIAIGAGAISTNISGDNNIGIGHAALQQSMVSDSVAIGNLALTLATTGTNTAVGSQALTALTTGTNNTAVGLNTLMTNISSGECTAVGSDALSLNTGATNTAVGSKALSDNSTGVDNVGVGYRALLRNTIADNNTAVGTRVLDSCTTGASNTGLGSRTMCALTTGSRNTAVGSIALDLLTTGDDNIAIGFAAGDALTLTDSDNIMIGDSGVVGDNNVIRIGENGKHTSAFIQGIHSVTPTGATETVIIDSAGEMGSVVSAFSTAVTSGGLLSIDVDTTKFSISDGTANIAGVNGELTSISFSGLIAQSTTYVGLTTFVSINSSGTVIYSALAPSNSDTRNAAFLGLLVHFDQINIVLASSEQTTNLHPINQIRDLAKALGPLKLSGLVPGPASNDFTLAISSGTILDYGTNFSTDPKNPHIPTVPAIDTNIGPGFPNQFIYLFSDLSSSAALVDVILNKYDDGTGTPGAAVGMNQWTSQRVLQSATGDCTLLPGQFLYNTAELAIAAVNTEGFVVSSQVTDVTVLAGYLVGRGGGGDLSDTNDCVFFNVGKFETQQGGCGVIGAASSTDHALVRFDGVSGKTIQNSGAILDDSDVLTGLTQLTVDNLRLDGNILSSTTGGINIDPVGNEDVSIGTVLASRLITVGNASVGTAINLISPAGCFIRACVLTGGAITTTITLDVDDSGKTFSIDTGAGYNITLPTASEGLNYRFVNIVQGGIVTLVSTGAHLYGAVDINSVGTQVSAITNFNFTSSSVVGDWVDLWGIDSTHWMIRGISTVSGGFTTS